MKCPECRADMEPIGYSIFEVVFGCTECDEEVEILRDEKSEKYVDRLKQGGGRVMGNGLQIYQI